MYVYLNLTWIPLPVCITYYVTPLSLSLVLSLLCSSIFLSLSFPDPFLLTTGTMYIMLFLMMGTSPWWTQRRTIVSVTVYPSRRWTWCWVFFWASVWAGPWCGWMACCTLPCGAGSPSSTTVVSPHKAQTPISYRILSTNQKRNGCTEREILNIHMQCSWVGLCF